MLNEVDLESSWQLYKINDRSELMKAIIKNVPDESIWSIEGIIHDEILNALSKHAFTDEINVQRGTVWPKERLIKIKLDVPNKAFVLGRIKDFDFSLDFIHQHIYFRDHFYFTSYDNLDETCTWVSKKFDLEVLKDLQNRKIVDFKEGLIHK